jgi:hypothetical protein
MRTIKDNKKIVVIIEDDYDDFTRIKEIVSADFSCPQEYANDEKFNEFRRYLQTSLIAQHTDPNEQKKMKNLLISELRSYCNGKNVTPIYLIDFLLDGESYNQSINGINFNKLILRKLYRDRTIPTLFITACIERCEARTNLTKLQHFCNEINDTSICTLEHKPNLWNDESFKNSVISFINNANAIRTTEPKLKQAISKILSTTQFPNCVQDNGKSLFTFLQELSKNKRLQNDSELLENVSQFKPPYTAKAINDFITANTKFLSNGNK